MNEIDRLLRDDVCADPPPDLTERVLRAVRSEATAPPPIRFPWRRLTLGMAASALVAAGLCLLLASGGGAVDASLSAANSPLGAAAIAAGAIVSAALAKWSILANAV